MIGLQLDLEDLLGCPVDVIASDALRGSMRDRVLRDARELDEENDQESHLA